MSTQHEALRLADELEYLHGPHGIVPGHAAQLSAAELRRLHGLNQELLSRLKLARDGLENWAGRGNVHLEQIDRLIDKAEGKAEAPTVVSFSNCDNKTPYRLTPTCTECGHDMVTATSTKQTKG